MDGSGGAPMAPKGGGLGGRAPIPKPKPKQKPKPKPKKEHQVVSSYNNALKKGQKTNSHKVTHATKFKNNISTSGKSYSSADLYRNNKLEIRRYYGKSGKVQTDIHYSNHGYPKTHPKVPHRHNWKWINGNWAPGKEY